MARWLVAGGVWWVTARAVALCSCPRAPAPASSAPNQPRSTSAATPAAASDANAVMGCSSGSVRTPGCRMWSRRWWRTAQSLRRRSRGSDVGARLVKRQAVEKIRCMWRLDAKGPSGKMTGTLGASGYEGVRNVVRKHATLTFSSIITHLQNVRQVRLWVDPHGPMGERCFYLTQDLFDFIHALPHHSSKHGRLSDRQQAVLLMNLFTRNAAIEDLQYAGKFRTIGKMRPRARRGPNVWELRTTDFRIFGYVPNLPHCFVGVLAASADSLHRASPGSNESHDGARDRVVEWRRLNGLDDTIWCGDETDLEAHWHVAR